MMPFPAPPFPGNAWEYDVIDADTTPDAPWVAVGPTAGGLLVKRQVGPVIDETPRRPAWRYARGLGFRRIQLFFAEAE